MNRRVFPPLRTTLGRTEAAASAVAAVAEMARKRRAEETRVQFVGSCDVLRQNRCIVVSIEGDLEGKADIFIKIGVGNEL